jgi:hypothetical protein
MTMQDESKPKNITIDCNNCGKFLAIYTGFGNSLFKQDFYCNLICEDEKQTKKRKEKGKK